MPLFLSVPEARSQHPQPEGLGSLRQPWTIPLSDATGKSQGYRQQVNLRPGLGILIDDYTLQDDLIVETDGINSGEPVAEIEMSFMLSGHNRQEKVRNYYNFLTATWVDPGSCQFHWQADERVLKFDIHIEPELFKALVGEQCEALPPILRQFVQDPYPSQHWFRHTQSTTTAMQSALHQILHCPYQGLTRWLYLEGKVMELIALRLDQVIQHQPAALVAPGLHAKDIERIHYASAILLQRLDNPPSLLELARLVELNDYKLKQGFRQVFGTTVFGYLQTHRMELAKQLLAEPTFKIAGVAQAIGYANQSHFCQMFKQQFGMTPRCYRSRLRR